MIRIGVIEDDSNMRKIVDQIIEKEIQGYEEVKQKTFESAEEFLQERVGYDIVISDIELPGINGIELGKRLSKEGKQTKLIYLTSYPEYAWESYLVEAYQYVLKIDMQERLPQIVVSYMGMSWLIFGVSRLASCSKTSILWTACL